MQKRNVGVVLILFLLVLSLSFSFSYVIAQEEEVENGSGVIEEVEGDVQIVDEEEHIEGNLLNDLDKEYEDIEFEGNGGISPDSVFYFLDEFFDRFGDELEVREEKIAEIKQMIEQENYEAARKSLKRYKEYAKQLEKEVNPERRNEARRSAAAIRKALNDLRELIPEENQEEFIDDVLEDEGKIVTSVEISSKIKDLCVQLAELDPEKFYDTCKTEVDGPKWQKDLFNDLTAEQEKEAKEFFKVLGKCMQTEGRDCECDKIPHKRFASMCSVVAPLAEECSEGDEDACDRMDAETENMFEILSDSPHLQKVLEKLDDFEEDRFEHHYPKECRDAGVNNRKECMKIMFSLNAPEECVEALEDGRLDISNERKARENCERIMFEENAPEECVEAGLRNHEECGKFMFKQNAPEECIEAGLTGENRRDHKKCEEIMRKLGGDRGPNNNHGPDCRRIEDSKKRLECYDGAGKNAGDDFDRFEDTKKRERECANSCRREGGAWEFSEGECNCRINDFERKDEFRKDEFRKDEFRDNPEGYDGGEFDENDYRGEEEFRKDEFREDEFREEFKDDFGESEKRDENNFREEQEVREESHDEPEERTEEKKEESDSGGGDSGGGGVTGNVIFNTRGNGFLKYWFR